jgi:hypothetical protein
MSRALAWVFLGATGHVVSTKEVPGGTDAVAKIKLAKRHP